MKEEEDITLNEDWLNENRDRLIAWELLNRICRLDCRPIHSQNLCDMIGAPKNYVFNVIKQAQKVCKQAHPKH